MNKKHVKKILFCLVFGVLFAFTSCNASLGVNDNEFYKVKNIIEPFLFPLEFSTLDLFGNMVDETSLGEKEMFFVYFWTTWCNTCVRTMPDLANLAEMYDGRVGFFSLLGDFDRGRETAIRIKEESGVQFFTFNANHYEFNELMEALHTGFVPTSVIIGRDGNIIGEPIVGGGINRLQTAIENALGG